MFLNDPMINQGCVHIPINGMSRVLRKLNVDAAPAMVGWDFSGSLQRRAHTQTHSQAHKQSH